MPSLGSIFDFHLLMRINHIRKKKHILETCVRLLFMLFQGIFASARPNRVHTHNFVNEECSTLHSYYLKLNNIIA